MICIKKIMKEVTTSTPQALCLKNKHIASHLVLSNYFIMQITITTYKWAVVRRPSSYYGLYKGVRLSKTAPAFLGGDQKEKLQQ